MEHRKLVVDLSRKRMSVHVLLPERRIELKSAPTVGLVVPDYASSFYTGLIVGLYLGYKGITIAGEQSLVDYKDRMRFSSEIKRFDEDAERKFMSLLADCGIDL